MGKQSSKRGEAQQRRAQSGRATGPNLQMALGMERKFQEKEENNINAVSWEGGYKLQNEVYNQGHFLRQTFPYVRAEEKSQIT